MEIVSYLLGKKSSGGGGGGAFDWTQIGYSSTPQSEIDNFNTGKNIYDTWDTSITSASNMYMENAPTSMPNFTVFPNVDTSNLTNTNKMFYNNHTIKEIGPSFDFSNVTTATNMFSGCTYLERVGDVMPAYSCNMQNMFAYCYSLKNVNKIRIANKQSNSNIFVGVSNLTINQLLIYGSTAKSIFVNSRNLDIKEIVKEDWHTSRSSAVVDNCTMTDRTIDEFLKYFKTLTDQATNYKKLSSMGFTQANCNQAVLSSEWTDLENAGWTTGY